MSERIFGISPFFSLNDNFELLYGPHLSSRLLPCQEIRDEKIYVGIVDNNILNPKRLLLVDKDRKPIMVHIPSKQETINLEYPGKSGFISFNARNDSTALREYVNQTLKGNYDRRDHLHCAQISDINNSGWKVFWAPLQMTGNLLHVRLVCNKTIIDGSDPKLEDAQQLKTVFKKEC